MRGRHEPEVFPFFFSIKYVHVDIDVRFIALQAIEKQPASMDGWLAGIL